MMRIKIVVGLMLLCAAPLTKAAAIELPDNTLRSVKQEVQDRSKEDACDCCQKCKAAKSPVVSKEKEGPTENKGCDDCCKRCGRVVQPGPEDTPPEILDKRVYPDIIDKSKQ